MEVQQIHGKWWCWKWNLNPHLSTLTPTPDPWAILLNRSRIQPLLSTSTPPTLLQATVVSCLNYCNSLTGLPISSFASSFNIFSVHQPEWSCHSINGFPSLLQSPAHLIQNKKARPSNDLQSPTIGPHPTRRPAVSRVLPVCSSRPAIPCCSLNKADWLQPVFAMTIPSIYNVLTAAWLTASPALGLCSNVTPLKHSVIFHTKIIILALPVPIAGYISLLTFDHHLMYNIFLIHLFCFFLFSFLH